MKGHSKTRLTVADVSGQNWDDMAISLLKASIHMNETSLLVAYTNGSATRTSESLPGKGSDLSHSDLHDADLRHADLRLSNLRHANLRNTRLDRANLEGADLRGADLRSAHLASANLAAARLEGAVFDQWTDLPFPNKVALQQGMIYLEISAMKRS